MALGLSEALVEAKSAFGHKSPVCQGGDKGPMTEVEKLAQSGLRTFPGAGRAPTCRWT